MRHLPKALITRPETNRAYAIAAMVVSVFVLAYSVRFGQVSILALYAVWMLPLAVEPRILGRYVWPMLAAFAFTLFAGLSTLWSEAPSMTLRAAIQYGTTILCAVVMARIVSTYSLVVGALAGLALALAYSILIGKTSYDVVDGTYRFVGAFASKNQLGFFAALAMLFAVLAAIMPGASVLLRGAAGLVFVAGSVLLLRSHSAGALATIVPVIAGAVGLRMVGRVAPTPRLVLVVFGALTLVALVLVGLLFANAEQSFLAAFGKDSTLTGRTLLWSEGMAAAAERPWFGSGYYAFWRVGHAPAEYLWEMFYITGKSGFHFHNTYIQTAVGVGAVGLAVLSAILLAALWLAGRAVLRPKITHDAIVCVALVVLLLLRSVAEIDFLYPYTAGAVLLTVAFLRLASPEAAAVTARPPRRLRLGFGPPRPDGPRVAPRLARAFGAVGPIQRRRGTPGSAVRMP